MFCRQPHTEVLQWQHRNRRTLKRRLASETAHDHWQYAALSANVYARSVTRNLQGAVSLAETVSAVNLDLIEQTDISNWRRVQFMDEQSTNELLESGVYVEVFHTIQAPERLVVVFEGTTGDRWSIRANLKWFLRILPGPLVDSYSIVGSKVVQKLHTHLRNIGYTYDPKSHALLSPEGIATKIVATGHSLGGGLAQFFAYTFNQATRQNSWISQQFLGPRVSEVFAFNTSPVTGWYQAPNPPRDHNVTGLVIHRIFEHGDILAYLRLITSRLIPGGQRDPEIVEYRYNFLRSANAIRSHSMKELAQHLRRAATAIENN